MTPLVTVTIKKNEPFEKAVRRFETECRKAGIIQLAKAKMYYEKPSRKRYNIKFKKKRVA
ncbi:MAG: 30S ribosomal protein S21 [bacterium]|nr:30S ribosomal protein S21 [bacterium]